MPLTEVEVEIVDENPQCLCNTYDLELERCFVCKLGLKYTKYTMCG